MRAGDRKQVYYKPWPNTKFLPQICIALEAVLLKLHECTPLATRSSLQGGRSFKGGGLSRDYTVMCVVLSIVNLCTSRKAVRLYNLRFWIHWLLKPLVE